MEKVPTWVDEAMTLVLLLYTGTRWGKIKKARVKKEIWAYICIMFFYLLYSLLMAINVSASVYLDFQQQVRPYVVFYCTWLLSPRFSKRQLNFILWMMYLTILVYLPFSRGRGEDVGIGQLCLNCAMMYYLFKPETRRNLIITIFIATVGLLSFKMKFVAEYIVLIAILLFLKKRLKAISFKSAIYVALLGAVVIYFTWEKFEPYFVSGFDTTGHGRIARPESYRTAIQILLDYFPFGSGLGTYATNAAAEYYSPLYYKYDLNTVWGMSPDFTSFIADAFYPTLAEYGLVGVFLFIVFWRRRLIRIQNMESMKYYKVGLMAFFALALESVADTSYLSGKGMGYFMLLGIIMNAPQLKRRSRYENGNLNENENGNGNGG